MSASRSLSRCVVILETGGAGAELFAHRIDAAVERLEVLFDELEQGGRLFVSPRSSAFNTPQAAVETQGDETCRVELVCTPAMTVDELRSLAVRATSFLSELPDVTPRGVPAVERVTSEADTDPGEPPDAVATREHLAKTRPGGVKQRPVPEVVGSADEVTDPQAGPGREEAITRPEGVISIRRR